jgi:hypothetical protein
VEEFLKRNPSGMHLETKFYHILSTSSKEVTQELGQKMDIVTAQVYQKIFEFEEKIPYKYVLIFWRDREAFMKNGGSPGVAAFYRPDTKDLVGFNLRADGTSSMDPYQTLFHEGWHQYFDFYIPNAPRWFDEGFAEVIYPTVVKGGKAIWKATTLGAARSWARPPRKARSFRCASSSRWTLERFTIHSASTSPTRRPGRSFIS